MLRIVLSIFFSPFISAFVSSQQLPSFVHKCKISDPDIANCIMKSTNEVIPRIANGEPELYIEPLDPLHFRNLSIKTGGELVKVQADLTNGIIMGLKEMRMTSFKPNFATAIFNGTFEVPEVKLQADYVINGKVMTFVINSKGRLDLNATDVVVNAEWFGRVYIKENKEYAHMDKIQTDISIGQLEIYLYNLFGKNEKLTESINKLINDNMNDLREDMNELVEHTLGDMALDYVNAVYDNFDLNLLYPK
ncbi:hypothetical protein FQA39_LY12319 [Lamprigera yunnana]|nr:hypothetical protein FQA39_LY12319 [Lamprigera yunnana]